MNPLIIFLRLVVPLLILKFPLIGGSLAVWLDNIDWYTKNLFGIAPIGEYQTVDKLLDLFYLFLLALVTIRFKNKLIRNILLGLFAYRLIGSTLFEITQARELLFIFPNIFENFFFFYYLVKIIVGKEPKMSYYAIAASLILVTIPKMIQEYSLHVVKRPISINLFGISYTHQESIHQAIYIFAIAILFGIFYKTIGKPKNNIKENLY